MGVVRWAVFGWLIIQIMEQILGKRSNRGRSTEYAALIKELLQEV